MSSLLIRFAAIVVWAIGVAEKGPGLTSANTTTPAPPGVSASSSAPLPESVLFTTTFPLAFWDATWLWIATPGSPLFIAVFPDTTLPQAAAPGGPAKTPIPAAPLPLAMLFRTWFWYTPLTPGAAGPSRLNQCDARVIPQSF